MKPRLLALIAVACIMAGTVACKKDRSDVLSEIERKIRGKWRVDNITINQHFGGQDHLSVYYGTSADYVEFKDNGEMHTYFRDTLTINSYKVISDKKISIDTDDANIEELTDQTLVLRSRDGTGSIGFTELKYYLEK